MAIELSNGHSFEFEIASGALGFDGKGYYWDYPFRWFRLLDPKLFTIEIKSLTRKYKKGNLKWTDIFGRGCVRFIHDGMINAVGLTNPGIEEWLDQTIPSINRNGFKLIGSISGTIAELVEMTKMLDHSPLVAIKLNVSCVNVPGGIASADEVIEATQKVKEVSRHPILVKFSVAQNYVKIARYSGAEAMEPNSVPASLFYGDAKKSPLAHLGGGGISGKAAQAFNWPAIKEIADLHTMKIIGSSVWRYEDIDTLRNKYGADAVAFGSIHTPDLRNPFTWLNPAKPTRWVRRILRK